MARKKRQENTEEITAEERAALDKEIEENLPEEEEAAAPEDADTPAPEQPEENRASETQAEALPDAKGLSFTKVIKESLFHEFTQTDLDEINGKIVEELESQKLYAEERAAVAAKIKRSNEEIDSLLELKENGGEERVYDVEVRYYCDLGKKYVIHPEKGYILRCEPITLEEREQDLPFSGEDSKTAEEPAPDADSADEGGFEDQDLNPETED